MLVRLERQAPARVGHHQVDARLHIGAGIRIVERLDKQMLEVERREPRDVAAGLRPDELQFVAARLDQFRSEEHTSALQSLMRISYAVFCLKKKKTHI